ncbi:hypothetical protein A2765_01680 [Candidatus Kaiserbacteria bacterium RIFCSPHIGHO2_01_FULL_56_24]|uniref:Uncharacterized protein n=1 Tax=Candidatus Kaiserbacteria bacterium RIFCSPHIGHO2_01_FULL_56_24 TaxID=1798487 RepID=A0A1F6DIH0_9BACT|nr:MAG: hypothetical protein A2765_01680 [Candidatus Kaiserbacteria bacterium RIFCSPHIGHO2_01_FULL_56_24]
MLEEGKRYLFIPPMRATGIQGQGDATKQFPDLRFESGTCVKIGTHATEFRGRIGDQDYKFFAIGEFGGSKPVLLPE